MLKEQQDSDAGLLLYNRGNSGGARPKAVFSDSEGHWIIKFRHTYDPTDKGLQEYRYNEIAQKCGITVPDFRLINGRYFAYRRFDIDSEGNRLHTATAGGLLCISLREPFMDYSNLLALTGYLTQNREDVEQMYRRMLFNYLTDNKDDHCKISVFMWSKTTIQEHGNGGLHRPTTSRYAPKDITASTQHRSTAQADLDCPILSQSAQKSSYRRPDAVKL